LDVSNVLSTKVASITARASVSGTGVTDNNNIAKRTFADRQAFEDKLAAVICGQPEGFERV
jgi:hypothetical protein